MAKPIERSVPSALHCFADTLTKLNPVPQDKIDRLFSFCPKIIVEDPEKISDLKRLKYLTSLVTSSSGDAINAVTHFVVTSKLYQDKILPTLMKYLQFLSVSAPNGDDDNQKQLRIDTVIFITKIIVQLCKIATTFSDIRQDIISSVLSIFKESVAKENTVMSEGILGGLGAERMPFVREEVAQVMALLELLITKDIFHLKSLQVLHQLAFLPEDVCSHDMYEYFFNAAQQFIQKRDTQADSFATAIRLVVSCGLNNPVLTERVTTFLRAYFLEYFDAMNMKGYVFTEQLMEEYRASIEGLSGIANKFPQRAANTVEFIVDVLYKSSATSQSIPQYATLRDESLKALGEILKTQDQKDLRLVNSVFTTLYTPFYLAHTKYLKQMEQAKSEGRLSTVSLGRIRSQTEVEKKRGDKQKKNELLLSNLIIIIGKITVYMNDSKVTELILQRLLQRINYPPQEVDVLIMDQLNELCVLGQQNAYDEIIAEYMNIFKRILKDTQTTNISNTAMPNALLYLAVNVTDRQIRENLLQRILRLFQQLGKDIITPDDRALSSPLIQGMGYLLPIVAELLRDHNTVDLLDPDPELDVSKLFRSVWYYCVLFHFTERDKWRTDWYESTRKVAFKMPALLSKKVTYLPQMESEMEALLQNGFTEKELNLYWKLLGDLLPGQNSILKNLSNSSGLYVLSIYWLETLRSFGGTFQPIFAYLEDPAIMVNESLSEIIKSIAEKTFPIFIEYLKSIDNDKQREEILQTETRSMMLRYCSVSPTARKVADKYIGAIAESFPQITWNSKCLQTLLDMVESVGKGCDLRMVGSVQLANSQDKIQLPDAITDRQLLLKDLVEFSTRYIKFGVASAPEQTVAIIHEYLKNFRDVSLGFLHHIGFSLAVEITSLANDAKLKLLTPVNKREKGATPIPPPSCVQSATSTFVNAMETKAIYRGEIEGVLSFLNDEENSEKSDPIQLIQSSLTKKFGKILYQVRIGEEVNISEFNSTIYRTAAFIISQKEVKNELIHMLLWAPVLVFTPESLKTGVGAWTWVLASRDELNLPIMNEMLDAWSWTITERIGLFSNAPRVPSPLTSNSKTIDASFKEFSQNKTTDPTPHRIWINFLSERFVIISNGHGSQMGTLIQMMLRAIEHPWAFSILPKSVCTRFNLLLLCLKILQSGFIKDTVSETVLRERVYQCALTWFCHQPTWYQASERRVLIEDVYFLIEFCKQLIKEDQFDQIRRAEKISESVADVYMSDMDGEAGKQEITLTRDLKQTRKLITLLVGNEIDRICAWTNPQNRLVYKIPDEAKFSSIRVTNWKEFLKIAWGVSPSIAIHMAARFPNEKKIRQFLAQRVREDPSSVTDVPEAFEFLVNETTVKENIPELKYALYWTNVSPPAALNLLQKNYNSHPIVTQYAVRVLHSFPPETIVYYIPQLVQTLRYDRTGLVYDYLVTAAKESELLAHQLIWNTQTYTEAEGGGGDLGKKARSLKEQIISGFALIEESRYKEEFEFFEDITSISSVLLAEAPSKEERKPLLVKELQKRADEMKKNYLAGKRLNLYLPTNPEWKVHGIIPTKASALQSAQKAPILVTFEVHSREEEEESLKEKEEKILKNYAQSCIFKVGDDVRQDMLAVQIIDLFKRIFKSVELDLFVYPYKIIATKPGCGMLEVVPRATSRDQLGKKLDGGLFEYFTNLYGPPHTSGFQTARLNFIKSMAGYAVVCFILQIKDRHNGNIMIDEEGHVIHIDFGFMFDSSPGGDMGFEVAPFKLSTEMIEIMGGKPDAEPFKWFMEMTVKAFLAVRQYAESIMTLVALMLDTNLPSFKPATMEHLRQRLIPDKSEREAAQFMTEQCIKSFGKIGAFATYFYDVFQHMTQGIDY